METAQFNAPPQIVENSSDAEPVLSLQAPSDVGSAGIEYCAAMAGHGAASSDQHASEDDESSGYSDESSDSSSSAAIDDTQLHPKSSGNSLMRDSSLDEAWKRKKERALQDDFATLREHYIPQALERSSSDGGNMILTTENRPFFHRSASDVGKLGKDYFPKSASALELSITDDDFEDLKGCIDLGFFFDESSLPAFSHTLPALEVYCAVAQSLEESPYSPCLTASPRSFASSAASTSFWRICRPGDAPEHVKGRLRHWAQAVACNAKLC